MMSLQSTTDAGRSLLGEALHWALPRLAGYVLAALGSVLAFAIWAVVYTYVWPGKPSAIETPASPIIETPAPVKVPAPAPVPIDDNPPIVQLPPDALTIAQIKGWSVYDANNALIGKIEDVVVSPDGKGVFFILGIGGGFLGGQAKDIAVPPQAVQFKKNDDSTWKPVLRMSKDAVKNAPTYTFDPAATKWMPDPAR